SVSSTLALATSSGFAGGYRSTSTSCSAGVIAGQGSSMQRDHARHAARRLAELDPPEAIGRRAGERAVARLNPSKPKPGRYPILFDPRVAASLLRHLSLALTR